MTNVIGYLRVSTDEQASNGAGLDAQRAAIAAEAHRRGWTVSWVEDAGFSAKNLKRPGILEALAVLGRREAEALVVSKLDRLSRSMFDFASLMERCRKDGWALVALDLRVDTTTPAGEAMANVMATFAQFERRLIGQRTREALAVRRAQGVKLGRPSTLPPDVADWILGQRDAGRTLKAIADDLNRDWIPTGQGGRCWYPSTVRAVLLGGARRRAAG